MTRTLISGWDMHVYRHRDRLLGPLKRVYDAQEAEQRARIAFKERVHSMLRFISGLVARDSTRGLVTAAMPATLIAGAFLASMPRPPLIEIRLLIGTTVLLALAVFYTTLWIIEIARRYEDGSEIVSSRWIMAAVQTHAVRADIDAWKAHAAELFARDYRDHLEDLQVLLNHIANMKTPEGQYLLIWYFIYMHMSLVLQNPERGRGARFVVPRNFIER